MKLLPFSREDSRIIYLTRLGNYGYILLFLFSKETSVIVLIQLYTKEIYTMLKMYGKSSEENKIYK